jgi:catechol 2,3-dioxygenase-like lactoylglutathione lyase family enzyme
MKRFHVHVAVPDLVESVRFYSTLFGAEPDVRKDDYAKWMLADPRVNFAISQRGGAPGVNHLGFQVDSDAELESMHGQLTAADRSVLTEKNVSCCYARSDKYWVTDPAGVAWETFHSLGSVPVYGEDSAPRTEAPQPACGCAPAPATEAKRACCGSPSVTETKSACCA